jgi:hypothetical protein
VGAGRATWPSARWVAETTTRSPGSLDGRGALALLQLPAGSGVTAVENTSAAAFVSPLTRFVARESKTRSDVAGALGFPAKASVDPDCTEPFACVVPRASTRTVRPAARSRTKTSTAPFVSPSTRFVADDAKATMLPSKLIALCQLGPLPKTPEVERLTQ